MKNSRVLQLIYLFFNEFFIKKFITIILLLVRCIVDTGVFELFTLSETEPFLYIILKPLVVAILVKNNTV